MWVVGKTRNDVPMQVRDLVSEAGEVDFVRVHQGTQAAFDSKHHVHEMTPRKNIQIAHFGDVLIPDDLKIAGIGGIVGCDNAATPILPDKVIPVCGAKWALHG